MSTAMVLKITHPLFKTRCRSKDCSCYKNNNYVYPINVVEPQRFKLTRSAATAVAYSGTLDLFWDSGE